MKIRSGIKSGQGVLILNIEQFRILQQVWVRYADIAHSISDPPGLVGFQSFVMNEYFPLRAIFLKFFLFDPPYDRESRVDWITLENVSSHYKLTMNCGLSNAES